jgi:ketosteroid isomerase-like protein
MAEAKFSLEQRAQNAIHAFFHAVDKGDGAALAELFIPDGEEEQGEIILETLSNKTFRGRTELRQFCENVHAKFPQAQHWEGNVVLSVVSGAEGEGEENKSEVGVELKNSSYWKAEVGADVVSRGTHDDLLRVGSDGKVRFVTRRVVHTWTKG